MVSKAPAVAFITLGCPKNEVDTDRMRASVLASAYRLVDEPDHADVVVVNTCSFIREATEESISTVLDIAADWLPERAGRHVVVAGCMPARYGEELSDSMPEVAAFVPVSEEGALLAVLERLTGVSAGATTPKAVRRTDSGPSAYLQISDGCHRVCAYCTIPSIRGPYVSRPLADIVAEAKALVAHGASEIVLIGQDISAWGHDLAGDLGGLAAVVRAVAAVQGVRWLRLMYVQPDGVSDDLLAAIAENDNVVRYLDIPLQHASKPVLRAMRRSGDATSLLRMLARIRAVLPDVALRTTLIAGFPGETTADVRELQRFLTEARFDYAGVFVYSPEDGTEAAALPSQIPLRTRRARAQRLRDLADEIGFERAGMRVGETVEVLVEGTDPDDGVVVGRWRGQAPEIDGLVLLDKGEPGQIVSACIVDSLGYDLEGEVIS
ncbi:MAG: 30S ribosomal protein S12 methylthiotransferase RimO [Coriobacteriia bacterium]|nr:30S ribosomal protein S12 methylthiotransferase RimO [Coriobacteriia bacterium]